MVGCFIGKRKDYKNSLRSYSQAKKKKEKKKKALKMKTKILSGWRSFFHQYEHRTKTVFSPCERKLLESMSCSLLLFKIKIEQNKTNKKKKSERVEGHLTRL